MCIWMHVCIVYVHNMLLCGVRGSVMQLSMCDVVLQFHNCGTHVHGCWCTYPQHCGVVVVCDCGVHDVLIVYNVLLRWLAMYSVLRWTCQ